MNGVTTQKSNEEMQKEVNQLNVELKPINDWFSEERMNRIIIAQISKEHDNEICPICGKRIGDREGCNGLPVVDTQVCGNCDKRYIFPFKMMTRGMQTKEIAEYAYSFYNAYLNAELTIELSNKINSLIANHTDVAK